MVMPTGPVVVDPEASATPVSVVDEISRLLPDTKGQLGLVAACVHAGITDRNEMVAAGAAANVGAVSNILASIRAIQHGEIPDAPTLARKALSATRSFLRQHRPVLSHQAVDHLQSVIVRLESAQENEVAQAQEEEELQSKSDELAEVLAVQGGVYVYTFPHYWRYPTVAGTQRTLLKVGMTTRDAAARIREQARGTAVPEDPLILRVYRGANVDPRTAERTFHMLLTAADHVRAVASGGGREWFETSVEFLDAIANVLGLETLQADGST